MSAQLRRRLDNTSLTGIFSGTGTIAHCGMGSSEKLPVNLAQSESMLLSGCIPASEHACSSSNAGGKGSIQTSGEPGMSKLDQTVAGVKNSLGKPNSRPVTQNIPKPT